MNFLINICSRSRVYVRNMDKSQIKQLQIRLMNTESLLTKALKDVAQIRQDLSTFTTTIDGLSDFKRSLSDDAIDSEDSKKTKYSFKRNGEYVSVYTDGACSSNGKHGAKAGIGVWFADNHPLNVSIPCPGRQTNNTAEILACAEACKVAAAHGIDKLEINTDSQFVINCITKWMPNWKRNNWKNASGKDVVNKDDLLTLERCASTLTSVKYNHVNGHVGIHGNEGADKLAVAGASM